jgi:glycosyltransferase involved in cell wall biosynthesis
LPLKPQYKELFFEPMKLSVLIPTYERKDLVCEALDRIIQYDDECVHEVIVSDNHSTDGTIEHLKRNYADFSKLRLTTPAEKGGALTNWRHCLSKAEGTHVHWHWSDDFLCGPLYRRLREIHSTKGYEVISWPIRMLYPDGFQPVFYSQLDLRELPRDKALFHLFTDGRLAYSPASYFLPVASVRKHFYDDIPPVGKLDPNSIAMGADALMIAGALMQTDRIGFLDDPFFTFRSHADSITVQNIHAFACYHVAFAYFQLKHGLSVVHREVLQKQYGDEICSFFFPQEPLERIRAYPGMRCREFARSVLRWIRC